MRRSRRSRAPSAPSADVQSDALQCRGVTVRYDRTVALDDIDVEVRPGERVALVGPSGEIEILKNAIQP